MNGGEEGRGGGRGGEEEMEEDGREAMVVEVKEEERASEKTVLLWGYLPGASPQRSPLLQPVVVRMPDSQAGDCWKDVSGGGCGFALVISEFGKLFTWGSTDDMGQSYVTSGKHEETPEVFDLPTEVPIVKAAAGWAHCVAVTAQGDVYTWGWKECVPTGRIMRDQSFPGGTSEKEEKHGGFLSDQASPRSQGSRTSGSGFDSRVGDENTKRRRINSVKVGPESSSSGDEALSAPPCLVILNVGVHISIVATGGRHTLALSDAGQVWGWGYGGEGQLGLGSRIRNVSSPHPVPCLESTSFSKERSSIAMKGNQDGQSYKLIGSSVTTIACGGRHSAAVTDTGVLLTFGWGLYGQCGQGSTDDELNPTCVSSLLGVEIQGIAAGLWHTVCTSIDGAVYTFGGNQFGQLGTGSDLAETLPKLLDHPCLENKNAKVVSCGARHSAMMTEDEQVFCWGWNKYGQLGLGDAIDRNTPALVPLGSHRPKNVSCGWWHTLVFAESPT
ncbi:ultraviolet-B receptor UVR8-like isoform X1 [Zingiber officinale]|uniref:ultraviolet-B receptor UVR8-like isoform X1 n=1 Tax=Zingiber officinale TaxID=94328 RepID=UPI001C4CDCB0|nr:ultraviolet-B receptor UVR8-like isoform X1 [Zingiber officinale]